MNCNLLVQILMMAMNGQLGNNTTVQNPQTANVLSAIKSAASSKEGTTAEDIEDQLSIFDNQLSMYEPLMAIPIFAQYLSPMVTEIKTKQSALELVYDNFDAFSGGDDIIDKYDRVDIEEAAEEDGNINDFSEEDLDGLYEFHEIDPEEEQEWTAPQKTDNQKLIKEAYNDILLRDPEQTGFESWEKFLKENPDMSEADFLKNFIAGSSPEMETRGMDNEDKVEGLYQFVLDRESDNTGKDYWTDVMEGGAWINDVVDNFYASEEYQITH